MAPSGLYARLCHAFSSIIYVLLKEKLLFASKTAVVVGSKTAKEESRRLNISGRSI